MLSEGGYFEKGVYYPSPKQPEEIEMIIRVKVVGMEDLDTILERVKAIKEYASCVPANMHINNNITVKKTGIEELIEKCGLRVISPYQQRLEI